MTIIDGILVLIMLSIFIFAYWLYTRDTYIVRIKKNQIMEFKTSMELSGLPIITFYQGENAYNFLLDTGSNRSYINNKANIKVISTGAKSTFMGSSGKDADCERVNVIVYRNNLKYEHNMFAADLDTAFMELKKEYGVLITGIIGCDFMDKYNYCLDFKEFVIYQR